jgi:hypothetical protein
MCVMVGSGLLASAALAQSIMECPLGLVSVGDSEAQVLELCGPPTIRQTWDQVRVEETESPYGGFSEPAVAIPQDEWVYDFGPTRFVMTLRFVDGVVRGIRTGGYGVPAGPLPLHGPES